MEETKTLDRFRSKLGKMTDTQLIFECGRLRGIRRNPNNKARMIEAKIQIAEELLNQRFPAKLPLQGTL